MEEEIEGLVTTKDRGVLDLYKKVADEEGMSLHDFLIKYKLGFPKRKGIDR